MRVHPLNWKVALIGLYALAACGTTPLGSPATETPSPAFQLIVFYSPL